MGEGSADLAREEVEGCGVGEEVVEGCCEGAEVADVSKGLVLSGQGGLTWMKYRCRQR